MKTMIEPKTATHLPDQIMEEIYQIQKRIYWELDFIGRCLDRRDEEIGLCNLPYDTLETEKGILDEAYDIYGKKEDANTAYNVTMDQVIDELEHRIRNHQISISEPAGNPRVVIVIEDGIISTVLTTDPNIQIDIIELDKNYADSDLCAGTYSAVLKEPGLQSCSYSLFVPGYEQEMGLEVDE